jgi:AcrR family transcriptional regulator
MMGELQDRREQEKQERYNAILNAAEKVFATKTYDRTSMDDIAREVRLSRALLYVYFKDKAAIQHGIMLRAAERLRERFESAREGQATGLAEIQAMGQAYYRFYLEEPEYFAALTKASTVIQEAEAEQAEAMKHCEMASMSLMVQALEAGLEDGSISAKRVSDPFQTALYLRGALHGVIMMCQQEMGESGPFASYPEDPLIGHTMAMLTTSLRA